MIGRLFETLTPPAAYSIPKAMGHNMPGFPLPTGGFD